MKIKLSYLPEEQEIAEQVKERLMKLFPGLKVHKSDHYPPFLHIYMSLKRMEKTRK